MRMTLHFNLPSIVEKKSTGEIFAAKMVSNLNQLLVTFKSILIACAITGTS